ncbi:G-type lectin S-receptor-like serine/threonine-protein kinase CES101 isoform X1 [Rhododendron vialii]|uniref:G-type lectin S-receptor-like serine/threonine-protein kinase CES101 isoform X1 n=2 Tax=Rhododendron vialii TaxID=182163 RepID=UPI00265D7411|nr:G-type lectin S-receptor-like serine/threonine-protein kinase CES101 isoform X1 [Rhododendron vialii]
MNPVLFLIFTFLCSRGGLDFPLAAGISTIGPGEELNSGSFLESDGGNFTLGFFTIPETNYTYLGIWYTDDELRREVWVANPNTPLNNNVAAALTIDNTTGILKITSGGNIVVNISNQEAANPTARIEDSGNLVLRTEKQSLWQSFDNPTNTLLPGMKLGFNTATGQNWTLTSWISDYVPASGAFTLGWEPTQDSGQLVVYLRGERYSISGPLKDQAFEFMPTLNDLWTPFHCNFSVVSNNDEEYLTFSVINGRLWMWELTPMGNLRDGANSREYGPDGFCYGYESVLSYCVTSEFPRCRSSNDKFEEKRVNFLPTIATSEYEENTSLSLSDCMERCWNNCSCVAFTVLNSNGTGCKTWTGRLEYSTDDPNDSKIYVLVQGSSSKGKTWIWIVIAVIISLLMLIVGIFSCLRIRKRRFEGEEKKRRKEYLQELIPTDSFNNVHHIDNDGTEGHHDLKMLSFASIVEATSNFSRENKLGQGGFGPVYKGTLQEGQEIAVKRLSRTSGQGLVEFKNELILIAKLQHKNLVRVLGCCIHGEEKMLVYEYLPNKSLDSFIFDSTKRELLDWKMRMIIIDEIAQGLLYLHKYSRMRVIHRDLKASNILLDENMNAKISDFGMARIFKPNETEAVTNRVVGTYGYMSPEYAMEGTFSEKSDVFSFGVLILEIVSGRRNTSFYNADNRPLNLIGYAWELWKEGTALELKDPILGDSCAENELLRIIHVGLLCVQEGATDRPTMSDVISMLNNEMMVLPAPTRPAFFTGRNVPRTIMSSESELQDCSTNNLTASTIEPR